MIPAHAHFIWLGPSFHWVHALAVRSAAQRGGFDRVTLHHTDDLRGAPGWPALSRTPNLEIRRLDPAATLARTGALARPLREVLARLRRPASKANVLRVAILAVEGGVYLDSDTITIAPFAALREAGAFCGQEHIAFPGRVVWSFNPVLLLRGVYLWHLRDRCRRKEDGWRQFRRIESLYARTVNNAVLGAVPGHALMFDLLRGMVRLPPWRQSVRYALGTHLLQDTVARWTGADLVVHPPPVFYPLGPEISEHWFTPTRRVRISDVLDPATRAVHWYASVRTRSWIPRLSPDFVRRHADTQLFSALVLPLLDDEEAADGDPPTLAGGTGGAVSRLTERIAARHISALFQYRPT